MGWTDLDVLVAVDLSIGNVRHKEQLQFLPGKIVCSVVKAERVGESGRFEFCSQEAQNRFLLSLRSATLRFRRGQPEEPALCLVDLYIYI